MSGSAVTSRLKFNPTTPYQPDHRADHRADHRTDHRADRRTAGLRYPIGQHTASVITAMKSWTQTMLPQLNQAAYEGELPAQEMASILNRRLLRYAPDARQFSLRHARQMLMLLGFCGSSVERHAQQQAIRSGQPATPGRGLDLLWIREQEPFSAYFRQVADLLRHPYRDTFVTFVEDNGPEVQVRHPQTGETLYKLPTAFGDGAFLTFSNQPAEQEFILLLKESTALQGAANIFLAVLQDPATPLDGLAAIKAALLATTLMQAVRAKIQEFMRVSYFTSDFFLDVLRKYACQWSAERPLCPLSGINDASALLRDVMMFAELLPAHGPSQGIRAHVRQVFPVLMPAAVKRIEKSMYTPSIEERILQRLGLCREELGGLETDAAKNLLRAEPWLAAHVALFDAQRDLSHAHFATALKYLVRPKHGRDKQSDPHERQTIVSSAHEATGIDPLHALRHLDEARAQHPLRCVSDKAKASVAQLLHKFGHSPLAHDELLKLTSIVKVADRSLT